MAELTELTQEELDAMTPGEVEQARLTFEEKMEGNQSFQTFRRELWKVFAATFPGVCNEAGEALESGHRGVYGALG